MDNIDDVLRPKCKRCKNHGIIVVLKDHEGRCPRINCACGRCQLDRERAKFQLRQRKAYKPMKNERPRPGTANRLNPGAQEDGGLRGVPDSGSPNSNTSTVHVPYGPYMPAPGPNQVVPENAPLIAPSPSKYNNTPHKNTGLNHTDQWTPAARA